MECVFNNDEDNEKQNGVNIGKPNNQVSYAAKKYHIILILE